jgi:PAS domain S-box-containing protein
MADRERVEQALRDSEEQYRLLFESNPHPMWVYDRETLAFLAVNDAAVQRYGYSREEFLAMTIKEIRPEADVQRLLDALSNAPSPALRRGEWKHRTKDGTVVEVEINAHNLSFYGKNARLVLVNDVTERKRAEERLRESEARFRAMCNASPVGIFLTEPDGRCIYDNAAHMRMSGLTWEEAMDFGWVKSIHPEDRDRSVNGWRAALESNTPYVGVNRYLHDDGTVVWADVRTAPVRDGERVVGYVGVVQDITERTRAEEELKVSRQGLRSLAARLQVLQEEERTLIAREIHDELGQSLTGLKMGLFWVASHLREGQETLKEKTASMARLVDGTIETVRKISAGLRPGILDDLGLEAAIEWQAQEFQDRTGIKTQFTSALGDARLDRDLSTAAFRIVQEALTNVARHAEATKVTVDLRELDGELVLMVEDNGRGVKSCEIADKQSLGILGMRERAHLFGGEVEIRGQEERGTTVALRIPLNQSLQIVKNHDQSSDRG